MTIAIRDDHLLLSGRALPLSRFRVASAQRVAQPLRSGLILLGGLIGPIAAMVWLTVVYGPGFELVRWLGGVLIGPGGIALACLIGLRWPRPWAVVIEERHRGYRHLPCADQTEAENLAQTLNQRLGESEG